MSNDNFWEGYVPEPVKTTQQEPVAWMVYTLDGKSVFVTDNPADFTPDHRALPLYTSPPAQRTWVGLTDEEIKLVMDGRGEEGDDDYVKPAFDPFGISEDDLMNFARAIEAKSREKNT
jgi:hypothetical protein